jgi:hypothetical protein
LNNGEPDKFFEKEKQMSATKTHAGGGGRRAHRLLHLIHGIRFLPAVVWIHESSDKSREFISFFD